MRETRRCLYCHRLFLPSPRRPQQRVCSQPECQRRRRANSRRQQLARDPVYVQVVRESQKKWWDEHPDYQKERRKANPGLVEKNRQKQHIRDQKTPPGASCQEQLSSGPNAFSFSSLAGRPSGAAS